MRKKHRLRAVLCKGLILKTICCLGYLFYIPEATETLNNQTVTENGQPYGLGPPKAGRGGTSGSPIAEASASDSSSFQTMNSGFAAV